MNILKKSLDKVQQTLFQDKTSELRAYHAIPHFKQYGQIAPFEPESIQIQTHSFCNGCCVYCPYPEMSKKLAQGRMRVTIKKTDMVFPKKTASLK